MKKTTIFLLILFLVVLTGHGQKPRLLITTDIGGDPDDQQSLIRLMLYSCDFEIEGLITSASGTPGELDKSIIRPDLVEKTIRTYEEVWQNLAMHREGYPSPDYLLSVVKRGNPNRGWEYVGEGHDTEASEWIISCADKKDARPLNISIWGGQTDVAQALWKVKNTRTPRQYNDFVSRFRIHDIADQDGIFHRMQESFPGVFYVLNSAPEGEDKRNAAFRGMYLGGEENLTSLQWIKEHVAEGHGPLGALYPLKTWTAPNPHGVMKEGDTPSWFYFLENGLNCPEHPEYGGWGGRFHQTEKGFYTCASDNFLEETNSRATVYRWRGDFQREFAARMDWCIKARNESNHAPGVVVNRHSKMKPLYIKAKPGKKIKLNASGTSDPDGDALQYKWLVYNEAGNYSGSLVLKETGNNVEFHMPELNENSSLHVILKVTDTGTPGLTGYKRIVLKRR